MWNITIRQKHMWAGFVTIDAIIRAVSPYYLKSFFIHSFTVFQNVEEKIPSLVWQIRNHGLVLGLQH